MRERTAIEWTNSTWNPVTGCTRISAGCDHCYAHTLATTRLEGTYLSRLPIVDTPENRIDPFAVRFWPERLTQPERWKDPRIIFVNSMSDLFHHQVPDDYVRQIFRVMLRAEWHVYQVLTKRPARALRFWKLNADLFDGQAIPSHIWIGTSVEDQQVEYRVRQLRQVPATLRFLSCEPLLGPLKLDLKGVGWVITGGESGRDARSMDLDWARDIRKQCEDAGVPFFFKQVGGKTAKSGGRILDGREWNGMPSLPGKLQLALI
jgi:protein gp37